MLNMVSTKDDFRMRSEYSADKLAMTHRIALSPVKCVTESETASQDLLPRQPLPYTGNWSRLGIAVYLRPIMELESRP